MNSRFNGFQPFYQDEQGYSIPLPLVTPQGNGYFVPAPQEISAWHRVEPVNSVHYGYYSVPYPTYVQDQVPSQYFQPVNPYNMPLMPMQANQNPYFCYPETTPDQYPGFYPNQNASLVSSQPPVVENPYSLSAPVFRPRNIQQHQEKKPASAISTKKKETYSSKRSVSPKSTVVSKTNTHQNTRVQNVNQFPSISKSESKRVVTGILKRPSSSSSDSSPSVSSPSSPLKHQSDSEKRPEDVDQSENPILKKNLDNINPEVYDMAPQDARYFVVHCPKEEDVFTSLQFGRWSCTRAGKHALNTAFNESSGSVYLIFFPLDTKQFCGMARLTGPLENVSKLGTFDSFGKWKSGLSVQWVFLKDIPQTMFSSQLKHILQQNYMVKLKQDCEEISCEDGLAILRIVQEHPSNRSLERDLEWHQSNFQKRVLKMSFGFSSEKSFKSTRFYKKKTHPC